MNAFIFHVLRSFIAIFIKLPPAARWHVTLACLTGFICDIISGNLNNPIFPPSYATIGGLLILDPL